MTAPRIPLFQRKGAPPAMADAPPGSAITDAPPMAEAAPTVQCQGCGATIDTASGAVVGPPPDAAPPDGGEPGGDDIGAKLLAMMGAGS